MTKAEQEFCERCPAHSSCGYVLRKLKNKCVPLNIFAKGYEQAESDLALTWQDMKRICMIADSIGYMAEEDFYKLVLKRFNEEKNRNGEA